MMQDPEHPAARHRRLLSYIAEFTSMIFYLQEENKVADYLPRVDARTIPTVLYWSHLRQEISR